MPPLKLCVGTLTLQLSDWFGTNKAPEFNIWDSKSSSSHVLTGGDLCVVSCLAQMAQYVCFIPSLGLEAQLYTPCKGTYLNNDVMLKRRNIHPCVVNLSFCVHVDFSYTWHEQFARCLRSVCLKSEFRCRLLCSKLGEYCFSFNVGWKIRCVCALQQL